MCLDVRRIAAGLPSSHRICCGNFQRAAEISTTDAADVLGRAPSRCRYGFRSRNFVVFIDGPIVALRARGECLCSRISSSCTHPRRADGVGSDIDSRASRNPVSRRACGYAYARGALVAPWLMRNVPSANAGSLMGWEREGLSHVLFRGGGCSASDPIPLAVKRPGPFDAIRVEFTLRAA